MRGGTNKRIMETLAQILLVLFLIGLSLLVSEAQGKLCWMGQEPDPESHDNYRWVIPVPNPCMCTEVRLGSLTSQTPCRPFAVTYYDSFIHTDNKQEIRHWLNCTAESVALNVISLNLTLPANGVVSDHRNQSVTFDLYLRPSPGAAKALNQIEFERYEVTAYLANTTGTGPKIATQVVSLAPTQDSAEVTLFSNLSVTFDLTQVSCHDFGSGTRGPEVFICAELSPSSEAVFAWKQAAHAVTTRCFKVCCAKSFFFNLERFNSQENIITQDRMQSYRFRFVMSNEAIASVIQHDDTAYKDFYEVTAELHTPDTIEKAVIIYLYMHKSYIAVVSTRIKLDFSQKDCSYTRVFNVCVDIQPSDQYKCDWNYYPTSVHQVCTPVYCVPDVQLTADELTVHQPQRLFNSAVHLVKFDLKFTPTEGSSIPINSAGDERYRVIVFLSHSDIQRSYSVIQYLQVDANLTTAQQQLNISDGVQTEFTQLTAVMDLSYFSCYNVKFLCASLVPAKAAELHWVQPISASDTACVGMPCISMVRLDVTSLVTSSGHQTYIISDGFGKELSLNFGLTIRPKGGYVNALNTVEHHDRFKVEAFLSRDSHGSSRLTTQVVNLTAAQEAIWLSYNSIFSFSDLAVTIDLASVNCTWDMPAFLCVELGPSESASTVWQQTEEAEASRCLPIYCPANVELNVQSMNVTGPLSDEAVQDFKIEFDIFVSSGSSQPVNSVDPQQSYNVSAFLTGESDVSVQEVVAVNTLILHHPQNVTDDAASWFQVNATFDLREVSCSSGMYTRLCVELQSSEEAAKVWRQSPSAVIVNCSFITCTANVELNVVSVYAHAEEMLSSSETEIQMMNMTLVVSPSPGSAAAINRVQAERFQVKWYVTEGINQTMKGGKEFVEFSDGQKETRFTDGKDVQFSNLISLNQSETNCMGSSFVHLCAEIASPEEEDIWVQSSDAITTGCFPRCCPVSTYMNLELEINESVSEITINDRASSTVSLPIIMTISQEAAHLIQAIPASIQEFQVKMWLAGNTEVNTKLSTNISLASFDVTEIDGEYHLIKTVSEEFQLSGWNCFEQPLRSVCFQMQTPEVTNCYWDLSQTVVNLGCHPIMCVPNIVLNVDALDVTEPPYIEDGDNTVQVVFDLHVTPTSGSSAAIMAVVNEPRYLVQIYLAMNLGGEGDAATTEAEFPDTNVTLQDNVQSSFWDLTANLSLDSVDCTGGLYMYVCASLLPSTAAGQSKWRQASWAQSSVCTGMPCVKCQVIDQQIVLLTNHLTFSVMETQHLNLQDYSFNEVTLQLERLSIGVVSLHIYYRYMYQNHWQIHSINLTESDMFWIWWDTFEMLFGTSQSRQPVVRAAYFGSVAGRTLYVLSNGSTWCNIEHGGIPPRFNHRQPSSCINGRKEETYGKSECSYSWQKCNLQNGSLHFQVHASGSVQIALSPKNKTTPDMYVFGLPSWNESLVTLTTCDGCPTETEAHHPWLMDFYDYTDFYVDISDGVITLRDEASTPVLHWTLDNEAINITHCGICAEGEMNYAMWQFCDSTDGLTSEK